MATVELLAVVEVAKEDRVLCQATGCGHPVFKRIHVVRDGGSLKVLGSECFKAIYGYFGAESAVPRYGSSDGRRLTDEERQLLIDNTARLVEQLETEYQELESQKLKATTQKAPVVQEVSEKPTPQQMQALEQLAKLKVREEYGINPDLPGWRGLVDMKIRDLLKG